MCQQFLVIIFFFPFLPIIHLLDALSERSPLIARTVLDAPRSRPSKGDGGTGGEDSSGEAHPDSGILLGELGARGCSRVRCVFWRGLGARSRPCSSFCIPSALEAMPGRGWSPLAFAQHPFLYTPLRLLLMQTAFTVPFDEQKGLQLGAK